MGKGLGKHLVVASRVSGQERNAGGFTRGLGVYHSSWLDRSGTLLSAGY